MKRISFIVQRFFAALFVALCVGGICWQKLPENTAPDAGLAGIGIVLVALLASSILFVVLIGGGHD